MPRETFEYEIDTQGNNVVVHRIEIEGYQDEKDEIFEGRDPGNPNIFKGDIKDILVIDEYIRLKVVAYGDSFAGWKLTIKHNGKNIQGLPPEYIVSGAGTSFPYEKLKWI